MDKIHDYFDGLEEIMFQTLSTAEEALNQLWLDFARYGPVLPAKTLEFKVPAPPPPEPSVSMMDHSIGWIERNPYKIAAVVTGLLGTGLLAGYSIVYRRRTLPKQKQVVVVLGGDTPFGLPLILDLEKKGFIVIASVATPEAVEVLEQKTHGHVRALVLSPDAPDTIPVFLRSLTSTLSRKFPLTAAGDPFVSPASHPYIHSVVSLLTLAAPAVHAPFEHVSLQDSYLPYLTAAQITPLTVIQSLLPMLRTGPSNGKKSIVICIPATEARVGLPFSSIQSMTATATLRAAQVLRREIRVASLTGKSEFMKNIKVVVVDVGSFNTGTPHLNPPDVYRSMESWTSSEKLTYGPAFAAIAHKSSEPSKFNWESFVSTFRDNHQYGVPRRPTSMRVFVNSITGVVSNGAFGPTLFGVGLGIGKLGNWLRGDRFSIGAGAQTYKMASFLPSLILDTLLSIPHFLISIRNALLPTQPFVRPTAPSVSQARTARFTPRPQQTIEAPPPATSGESDPDDGSHSDTGSEADVESNSGDGMTTESWISLPREDEQEQKEAAPTESVEI